MIRPRHAVAVVAAGLVLVALADAHAQPGGDADFTVSGEVHGLYPGVEATLAATVVNPQSVELLVTSTDVDVGDASAQCPADVLTFAGAAQDVLIAAGETGTVPIPVRMAADAPDTCQGASWPLTFHASAIADPFGTAGATPPPHGRGAADRARGALAFTGAALPTYLAVGSALLVAGIVVSRLTRARARRSP